MRRHYSKPNVRPEDMVSLKKEEESDQRHNNETGNDSILCIKLTKSQRLHEVWKLRSIRIVLIEMES